jgi:hypothetical protein
VTTTKARAAKAAPKRRVRVPDIKSDDTVRTVDLSQLDGWERHLPNAG